jgi:hypothetical protein
MPSALPEAEVAGDARAGAVVQMLQREKFVCAARSRSPRAARSKSETRMCLPDVLKPAEVAKRIATGGKVWLEESYRHQTPSDKRRLPFPPHEGCGTPVLFLAETADPQAREQVAILVYRLAGKREPHSMHTRVSSSALAARRAAALQALEQKRLRRPLSP